METKTPIVGDSKPPVKRHKRRWTAAERNAGERIDGMSGTLAASLVDRAMPYATPEQREELIQKVRKVDLKFTHERNQL